MKYILLILTVCASINLSAQKYFTKTGITDFKASVEAFEPVEATNKSTTVILDTSNGNIAGLLFVKAFHFEIALMQEHFNESYMDSDMFPKAKFKGSIKDFSIDKLSETSKTFTLIGLLEVHGKSKPIEIVVNLCKKDSKILLTSMFGVKPEDYGIKIPSIVREKIAKTINITLDYELIEKK
ncbi:YceI family protein [Tenacibaculum sp. 1B UA]|uniref:YceI family protein n=1 Tax=Tenacibaculum sp. 1B UA TaxID=2922252 RepID=UPI002A24E03B|nr:YceI family protein [Tenacibaculum sp. 1B UA]MDX8553538.1 YceI family protein [Tenacibaculum sp. 1B UA]